MQYDPADWYWLAEDGRVFASKRAITVDKTDTAFDAFSEAGGMPTPWPRDLTGAQTEAALDDVLRPYGLSTKGVIRTVRGPVLVKVLDKTTKVCARDLAYVAGLETAREDMPSLARMAAIDGSSVKAWFDAALSVTD